MEALVIIGGRLAIAAGLVFLAALCIWYGVRLYREGVGLGPDGSTVKFKAGKELNVSLSMKRTGSVVFLSSLVFGSLSTYTAPTLDQDGPRVRVAALPGGDSGGGGGDGGGGGGDGGGGGGDGGAGGAKAYVWIDSDKPLSPAAVETLRQWAKLAKDSNATLQVGQPLRWYQFAGMRGNSYVPASPPDLWMATPATEAVKNFFVKEGIKPDNIYVGVKAPENLPTDSRGRAPVAIEIKPDVKG